RYTRTQPTSPRNSIASLVLWRQQLPTGTKRWINLAWCALILGFAALHALHLGADFPNHTPWMHDWAKYTDEGWYGNAAIRAHLFGNWYLPGDFNPAVALPVLPFLEWLLFFLTGVSAEAARGLAITFFFANLLLSYWLLRSNGPRWSALFALTLLVTSPFLYSFSRLAILEPLLTTLTLLALNLAVRLAGFRRPILASFGIGVLFALMMLTKTTAIFLLPALAWAVLLPLWRTRGPFLRCALVITATSAAVYAAWLLLVVQLGLFKDYQYLFFINTYPKPALRIWPLLSLWWSFHGGLWVDHILMPLAGLVFLAAIVGRRTPWGHRLLTDPVFGVSVLAVAGYIFFMTMQNHPQARYFAVLAFFCFFLVARGAEMLLSHTGFIRQLGWAVLGLSFGAAAVNGAWTLSYALHPEYTFIPAARALARFVDEHPNGNRLLVSTSGDEITLMAHLPTLCDDFGTLQLPEKLLRYQPGWFATWNGLDPGTLADLHTHYSLEQVASFRALDDPERNRLVLFKLHPLPHGLVRDQVDQNLQIPLPEDKFDVPID
ncbi:MAG: glycosyltransferase family 39 protein, partial [Terracidiphilus sp.]